VGFAIGPSERRLRLIGAQQSDRMGIEREDDRRAADAPGLFAQPFDDRGMTAMDAVEIADGHGAAADRGG
jgi:hypothetical protein